MAPVIHEEIKTLPVLALRGLVLFPNMTMHFDVGRHISLSALHFAMQNKQNIYLITQRDVRDEVPTMDNLYSIGCVARVVQILKTPDNTVRVMVEGISRAKHLTLAKTGEFYSAAVGFSATYPFPALLPCFWLFLPASVSCMDCHFHPLCASGILPFHLLLQ